MGPASAPTLLPPPAAATATAGEGQELGSLPSRLRPLLRPGWPLNAIFVGFPIWWILGVSVYVFFAMAAVMAFELVRRRSIPLPRGFTWWLLFLFWVAASVVVLQVDAPGAVPGSSVTRYLIWAYRLGWFVSATVVLLYVVAMWREVSTRRITRAFSWMFIWIVAGGLLGSFAPFLNFPSLLELIVPHRITSIGFIYYQVHPTLAQVGTVLGYRFGRPSAPFSFANDWGLNFLCFLPFFVVAWLGPEAGWRRKVAPFVLAVSVIPVIFSLNRGLWFTIVALAFFVAIRSLLMGRVQLLLALIAAALATTVLVLATPLGGLVADRFSSEENSNTGRSNLVLLAVNSVADGSPVLGYGSTRDVQGSFKSIALGDTVQCPFCSPPPLGTQGRLWLVVFSQGFAGALWYVGFLLIQFFGYRRLRSTESTAWLAVVLANLVTLPVYDALGPAIFALMTAAGLLWRERRASLPEPARDHRAAAELQAFGSSTSSRLGVRAVAVVCVCAAIGAAAGGLWQARQGSPSAATVALLVPEEPAYPQGSVRPSTIDTVARIAAGPRVLEAMGDATHLPDQVLKEGLHVSALPNTRVLVLELVTDRAATSRAGIDAATRTLMQVRSELLRARRSRTLHGLQRAYGELSRSLILFNRTLAHTKATGAGTPVLLKNTRDDLRTRATDLNAQIAEVQSLPLDAGDRLRPVAVAAVQDGWTVKVSSGFMLGFLVGCLLVRRRRWPATARARRHTRQVPARPASTAPT